MKKILFIAVIALINFTNCVPKKQLEKAKAEAEAKQAKIDQLNGAYLELQKKNQELADLNNSADKKNIELKAKKEGLEAQIDQFNKQIELLKQNNNVAVDQLKNLAVVTDVQAQSIKKSLDNLGSKDLFIQDLQSSIARKDSLNMQLILNLKGALGDMNDEDVQIKLDKSVVYIDISDKLLFKSGSYTVTEKAKKVLGKVAKVLLAQPSVEFMVEGHTDSLTVIENAVLIDNWDLSVKRATSVVRILQNDYNIPAARMTAAGRSQYKPIAENATSDGRTKNRRTRIVILPQLDQFFKLLEKK